jgi:alpha-glucosidase
MAEEGHVPWWRDAVVYQIYPRSFLDTDGDGVGDLRGIEERLDHLSWLGVDAVWISPFYRSPMADFGYDVSDYCDVDPLFGTLADADRLIAGAHRRGIRVLVDWVPNHTSDQHPWFRESRSSRSSSKRDWYHWRNGRDGGPPNNWRAAFGGPAWTRDERTGRYYLHSFYAEQPDLDWRNPAVVEAMQDVVRFWLRQGADGFRLDAIDRLAKDPGLGDDPPSRVAFPFPQPPDVAALELSRSSQFLPGLAAPLAALRAAAGEAHLVGEVYRTTAEFGPYLEHLDSAFMFELMFAPWEAPALGDVIERGAALGCASWMLSNHDFSRVGSRIGERQLRAAAMLLLTLPGAAYVYQGDEVGTLDGPGGDPPIDRIGRDRMRHPMRWDDTRTGGFTTGTPWLPAVEAAPSVAAQRGVQGSLLELYRRLIRLRPRLGEGFELLTADPGGLLRYRRGAAAVTLNVGDEPADVDVRGAVLAETHPGAAAGALEPGAGVVAET